MSAHKLELGQFSTLIGGQKQMKNITIQRLTPDFAEKYAHFFDVTPHDVNHDEMKCYCITWRSDETYADAGHWFDTREERRSRAIEYVKSGCIRGYLAYCGDEIIGWCNTNEHCKMGVDYLRGEYPIGQEQSEVKVKPIFCFVIHPDYQRMGVATRLLQRICADAAKKGFDYVEAYVHENFISTIDDFRGPRKLYEKCGFEMTACVNGKAVMRKKLK